MLTIAVMMRCAALEHGLSHTSETHATHRLCPGGASFLLGLLLQGTSMMAGHRIKNISRLRFLGCVGVLALSHLGHGSWHVGFGQGHAVRQ